MSTGIAHAPIHLGLLIQVLFAAEHLLLKPVIVARREQLQAQKLLVIVAHMTPVITPILHYITQINVAPVRV